MMTEKPAGKVILFRDCKMLLLWGQKLLGVNIVVYILEKALVVIVI